METNIFDIGMILLLSFFILFFIASIAIQIWMLVEILTKEKESKKLIFWLLMIILLGLFGAIFYLVIRRPKRKLEERYRDYSSDLEDRVMSRFNRIKVPRGPLQISGKITRRRAMTRWSVINNISVVCLILLIFSLFAFIYLTIPVREDSPDMIENPEIIISFMIVIVVVLMIITTVFYFLDPRRGWNEYYLVGVRRGLLRRRLLEHGFEETDNDYYKMIKGRGVHIRLYKVEPKWECPIEELTEIHRLEDVVFIQAFTCGKTSGPAMRIMEYVPIGTFEINLKLYSAFMELLRDMKIERIYDCTFKDVRRIRFR